MPASRQIRLLYPDFHSPALVSENSPQSMTPRFTYIRALCAFSCMLAQITLYSAPTAADESAITVKMDNKTIFIPETKLTQKNNPVTSFLYIGSWAGGGAARVSLCGIDVANNQIHINFPESLLENSTTRLLTQNDADAFLGKLSWGDRQATQVAFKVNSEQWQSITLEAFASAEVALFLNGKPAGYVNAGNIRAAGGRASFTVTLQKGENILNMKLYSSGRAPGLQMSLLMDRSGDLMSAWQQQGGLLIKFLYLPKDDADASGLEWFQNASKFSVSFEVRDVSSNTIVFEKQNARLGRSLGNEVANLAPGIYEASYHVPGKDLSELFVVGNPDAVLKTLLDKLSGHDTTPQAKLDIEAQARRARILLAENNYDSYDRKWQAKLAYTLSSLAEMERNLGEGVVDIAKDQTDLHIRGFASKADGSPQYYRLFVPSTYNPGSPLPLLVMVPARIFNKERPFIEGPVMANLQEARHWTSYAEKYGFALIWPGYRGDPEGYTYESLHIDEAIQALEKDYNIDKSRISLFGSCGAGYNAGRLASEYPNRFAAIVYDRAVFDREVSGIESMPTLVQWYAAVNPSRHVLANRNLKIFVMHDNTAAPGHGDMELSTQFLERAKETRNDVVQCLGVPPAGKTRMDMVFGWVTPCKNKNPSDARSHFSAKAGYTGPISEAFATPVIIVEGTRAVGNDLDNMQSIVGSLRVDYAKYFHGAQCVVKKDNEVTQEDIASHTLILVGNPVSNSVWEKLQPDLAIKMTPKSVLYKNNTLTGNQAFQAIVKHPSAADRYVVMIGAGDLRQLRRIPTMSLFTAWYDCMILTSPRRIIAKLDDMNR